MGSVLGVNRHLSVIIDSRSEISTERLKKTAGTTQIPIVIFTAHLLGEDQERTEEAGADGFLAKPCQPADIVAEIERLIGPAIAPRGS
jgi:CheY-like chemotaxis protein